MQAATAVKGTRELPVQKMSRDHFAFVRGWLQGVQMRVLWDRYLAHLGPFDERRSRTFMQGLRLELEARARRAGRTGYIGLLRRHKDRIAEPASGGGGGGRTQVAAPSLEEFALGFPEDMYSEAELLELWTENYGQQGEQKRTRRTASELRARLLERQLRSLEVLEELACEEPRAQDQVAGWLSRNVSARLQAVGIHCLGDLHAFIGRWGVNWHKRVPRVGAKGAALIVDWLEKQRVALGPLPQVALLPAAQAAELARGSAQRKMGIAPLERLILPNGLTTMAIALSPERRFNSDLDAIEAWLALRPSGSNTWRAYRREAERFLLWSVFIANKPVAAIHPADCAAYQAFLAGPDTGWTAPRNTPRWSDDWRPFEGPLSKASASTAVVILRAMCEWLRQSGHIAANPWVEEALAPAPIRVRRPVSVLQEDSLRLESWLEGLPANPASLRIRAIMGLTSLGLAPAAVAAATVGWLRCHCTADDTTRWTLEVRGGRTLEVPQHLVEVLRQVFASRGISPDLLRNAAETPLIGSLQVARNGFSPQERLTGGRVYELIVAAAARCADWVGESEPQVAARIRQMPSRWLRTPLVQKGRGQPGKAATEPQVPGIEAHACAAAA